MKYLVLLMGVLFSQNTFCQVNLGVQQYENQEIIGKTKLVKESCVDAKDYYLISAKKFISDPKRIFPFDLENLDKTPPFNPAPPEQFAGVRVISGHLPKIKDTAFLMVDNKGRVLGLAISKRNELKYAQERLRRGGGELQKCMKDCGDTWACFFGCVWDKIERVFE